MPIPIIPAGFAAAAGGGSTLGSILPSIISGGAKLLGGLFGSDSAEEAADEAYQRQKEFAQKGIQWRVADAKAAGIHPLYALGAQPMSFTPSSVGADPLSYAVSDLGQDVSRAAEAVMSGPERVQAKVMAGLQLERAGLENDLLRSQIARNVNMPAGVGIGSYGNPNLNRRDIDIPIGHSTYKFKLDTGDPAQIVQDQLGDIMENLYGMWRTANSFFTNVYDQAVRDPGPVPFVNDLPPGYYTRRVGR